MLAGIVAGAQAVQSGASAYSAATANKKDPQRAAAARQALERAVGGSLTDAQYMLQQRFNSATDYGKAQFAIAWQELEQRNPAMAAEALKTRVETQDRNDSPSVRTQLGNELERLWAKIRAAGGDTIQRIGSGVVAGAAGAVDPEGSPTRYQLPLTSSQIYIAGAVLLAGGLVWYFSKKR